MDWMIVSPPLPKNRVQLDSMIATIPNFPELPKDRMLLLSCCDYLQDIALCYRPWSPSPDLVDGILYVNIVVSASARQKDQRTRTKTQKIVRVNC